MKGYKQYMPDKMLTMELFKETFGVCRLSKDEQIPKWVNGIFFSITKTEDELSIVCNQDNIPDNILCEKDFRILKIVGPLDFSLVGILSAISTILSRIKISIFATSTYDTDYILVRNNDIDHAVEALIKEGYNIIN